MKKSSVNIFCSGKILYYGMDIIIMAIYFDCTITWEYVIGLYKLEVTLVTFPVILLT